MQKLYSQIIGMPVFDEYSTSRLALVQDVVLDPETGKILAFLVKNNRIVVPVDIAKITDAVFINDKDHIIPMQDVLRVSTVAKIGIHVIGAQVVTEKARTLLGRVVDYEFDTTHMTLTALIVAKTFFFFRLSELSISARQIVRIEKNTVTVKELHEKKREEEKVPLRSSAYVG